MKKWKVDITFSNIPEDKYEDTLASIMDHARNELGIEIGEHVGEEDYDNNEEDKCKDCVKLDLSCTGETIEECTGLLKGPSIDDNKEDEG